MDQFKDAESYLLKSFICYEQIFTNLGKLEEAKTNIVDTYIEAYHWLVFVSVVLGKKSQALLVSEQGRSRALSENLQTKYGLQGDATKSSLDQEVCLLVSGTSPSFVVVSLSDKYLHLFTLSSLTPLVVHPAAMQMTDEAEQWLSRLKYLINRVICDGNLHVRQNRDDTFEDRSLDLDYDDESEHQHVLTELARVTLGSKGSEKTNEIGGESSGNRKDKSVAKMWGGGSECHLATRSPLPHTTGKPKASDEGTSGKVPQEHDEDVCSPPPISSAETLRGSGLLKELYRILIEPTEKKLTQDEVVFVPEGVTFMVPFGALQSPDGRFLSEKKAIRFGPSLTTLKLLRECPEDKHCKRGVLVFANPRSNANVFTRRNGADVVKSFHERFANLPAASKEAIKIREILPDVTCLIEYQATKNAVMQSLEKGVGVIHIASHGDSQTGEILVAPEPRMDKHDIAEKEEYLLTMREISSCQINASLVVLSCCHSGRGQIRAEGVMGLARAFLAAGARSVLATLWTIGDNATLEFMERFYRHLASGLSTSASLKRTIWDTISMNDKYSHPYYWGAFVLVGDDVTIR
ncbi:tetratricopeptide repeat protein 28 [Nematostella vectensis]|nr:tetratricopeptide repeat protein 28 [Nematostella vectensis]